MRIALDYDHTYTADPTMWLGFIDYAISARGHEVVVVTMRAESHQADMDPRLLKAADKVYFTDLKAKRPFMDALGVHVDIWIDDSPQFILYDAKDHAAHGESAK